MHDNDVLSSDSLNCKELHDCNTTTIERRIFREACVSSRGIKKYVVVT